MATRVKRPTIGGLVFFEALLGANEVLVLPVNRSVSRSGDSTLSVAATAGTLISYSIEHPDVVATAMRPGGGSPSAPTQAYISSITGDYPATSSPAAFARLWQSDTTVQANTHVEMQTQMTAIRITAPAGGGFVIVYGDY
jgi:hypothetical protein